VPYLSAFKELGGPAIAVRSWQSISEQYDGGDLRPYFANRAIATCYLLHDHMFRICWVLFKELGGPAMGAWSSDRRTHGILVHLLFKRSKKCG
jgi:hypothetical protein